MDYFSNIVGQNKAISLLKKSIKHNSISHAYLFLGPAGIGKMLTAEAFARSVIQSGDPEAQLYFKENLHPDLQIINRLENKSMIGKEQITKELEPWLGLKPYRTSRRVAIIRDSHLMSQEAANALLKTLEEPPEHALIILVSDDSNLLETIISRCQLLRFFNHNDHEIEKYLLNRQVDPDKARHASRLGQGSISLALRFVEEEALQEIWAVSSSMVEQMISGEKVEIFNTAEKMERNPDLISNMLVTILRDINIFKKTGREELLTLPGSARIAQLLKEDRSLLLIEAIGNIMSLKTYYRSNVNSLLINMNISYELWKAVK
ncbi:MAG: hypothetical protein PHC92_02550 [Syntrophomonadaceae bacterium]|nr:hypothetical protein [Syntrophomonadaceae bacterium]MDD3023204.1 hypothetical protein [Syntrophomonadaceae bacterium]